MEEHITVTFENPNDPDDNNVPSPYIYFGSINEDLAGQRNPNEIVIPMRNIRVVFSFPLSRDVLVKFESSNPQGFTRNEIARKVYEQYSTFYREETNDGEVEFEQRIKGNPNNKPYGIWAHSLEGLALCEVHQLEGDLFSVTVE